MAQQRCSATSRNTENLRTVFRAWTYLFTSLLLLSVTAKAGLYTPTDQIVLLSPDNIDSVIFNSSRSLLVEFYASWCGHCIAFSPTWKGLARDIKEWKPAVDLAAMDCAERRNRETCYNYNIQGYPTIKFFQAFSKRGSKGLHIRDVPHDVKTLRQGIVNLLESNVEAWPPACPPLEPASEVEIDNFFDSNNVEYLALIFETADSYVGREVTLDLLQYENIAVRRVLSSEQGLVSRMRVTDFPSCYLYYANGNYTRVTVNIEARSFYSYALQKLPRVARAGKPQGANDSHSKSTVDREWREFNRSRVYMADLESALHYSLRVEVAAYPEIRGEALSALKLYISVLAKYFPGRPVVMNLLQALDSWLTDYKEFKVSYSSIKAVLDNAGEVPNAVLPNEEKWVGCQGSQPHYRGYPCSVWTLFHLLTVQAAESTSSSDPLDVLKAMRSYVKNFFGCRECATHFESMAEDSMGEVTNRTTSVLWLWARHNQVNSRLAGALSEDPQFPKIQWPPPDMCPQCHSVTGGEHEWKQGAVLDFLRSHFAADRILRDHLEGEAVLLAKQAETQAGQQEAEKAVRGPGRRAREAGETVGEEEEETQEGPVEQQQEEEEDLEEQMAAGKPGRERAEADQQWGHISPSRNPKPSIVGLRRQKARGEDIVDLDSFINQHYKMRAVRDAAAAVAVLERNIRKAEERLWAPRLQPKEPQDYVAIRKKRDLAGQYVGVEGAELEAQEKHWISLLSLGFSRLDISLCVLLYCLSSLCLLAMYLYFKMKLRLRRGKMALP
uniref:Sulfhydryl oxidase n=1 Tax=Lepisosteus oculatus TaxID=7918 RepID=W5MSC8_LEPOC|nr:PREDICTED: sulfhydryl oxidase 1 [Lepisosteus oculatus]